MRGFLDRINELWSTWIEGLSAREKRMLGMVFSGGLVLLALSTFYLATSKISNKRKILTQNEAQFDEIRKLESEYNIAKERNERMVQSIRSNDISLLSLVPSIVNRLGLSVSELTEQRRPLGKTNNVEVSVKLSLSKLSIDKLTALIEAIESDEYQGRVKVTRLKINKRFDEPDLLDLQMTVSTWKSA